MSEQEFTPTPPDERDKVAQLEAQLEKAKFDAHQHEAFGKYDVTVPNEGEETYQSYLDKRSNDGVVGDGDSLRSTASGKFASLSDYEARNGTTDEYDNSQFERQSENEVSYESLSLQDLARKYGESEALNDKTMALDVLEVLDAKMNDKAAANGWSAETKDLHYGQLMNIADKASRIPSAESSAGTEVSEPSTPEKNTTASTFDVDQDSKHPALDGESQEEYEARNGDKIDTLDGVVLSPLPEADKIDTLDDVKLAEVPEHDETDEEGVEARGFEDGRENNGAEDVEDSSESTEELDAEKQSIWKRINQRTSDLYLKAASTFGTAMFVIGNHIPAPKLKIDKDGKPETPEAFRKRVQRYGAVKTVGFVALLIAVKYGLPHLDMGLDTDSNHGPKTEGSQYPLHPPFDGGGAEGLPIVPINPEFNINAHTVTRGEGWYNTFKEMGITNAAEQANLLEKAGPQLEKAGWAYKMPNGLWGISHTGHLNDSVLKLIENNR